MKVAIAKPFFDRAEEDAVAAVLRSGWVSLGARAVEFEQVMARYTGLRYGCAVNSGTSALHLILRACSIGPGDEVIVPAFTCVATVSPIEHVGAQPVLVDIELGNFGIACAELESVVTSRTRAVILVHLFGGAADIDGVQAVLRRHPDVLLIEDVALGLGARVGGRHVGTFGRASFLSFHPRKMITTGEGGMVLSDDAELARIVGELRNYGASVSAAERHDRRIFDLPGYASAGFNYKMTDVQAAIGLEQMKKLPQILERRGEIAGRYQESFADLKWMRCPEVAPGTTYSYQSFTCLLDATGHEGNGMQRALFEHLDRSGVAAVQGAQSIPTTKYFRERYGWRPEAYPSALRADQATVCLPIHPQLSQAEQKVVIEAVRGFDPPAHT